MWSRKRWSMPSPKECDKRVTTNFPYSPSVVPITWHCQQWEWNWKIGSRMRIFPWHCPVSGSIVLMKILPTFWAALVRVDSPLPRKPEPSDCGILWTKAWPMRNSCGALKPPRNRAGRKSNFTSWLGYRAKPMKMWWALQTPCACCAGSARVAAVWILISPFLTSPPNPTRRFSGTRFLLRNLVESKPFCDRNFGEWKA